MIASGSIAFTQNVNTSGTRQTVLGKSILNSNNVTDSVHEVSFGQIKQVRIAWIQSQELEKENTFLYKEIDNYSLQIDYYNKIIIQKDSITSVLQNEVLLLQKSNTDGNIQLNNQDKTIQKLKIERNVLGGLSLILLIGIFIK